MKYIVNVKPTHKPREWETTEELKTPWCTIPKGFIFDGCSVPFGLRWLFPHGGAKFPAGCIHDYLYRTGMYTRYDADTIFQTALDDNNVDVLQRWILYKAVRYFGKSAWDEWRIKDKKIKEVM